MFFIIYLPVKNRTKSPPNPKMSVRMMGTPQSSQLPSGIGVGCGVVGFDELWHLSTGQLKHNKL